MKLSVVEIERFEKFIDRIYAETYPEVPTPLHVELTRKAIETVLKLKPLDNGSLILDIGCGQGLALEEYKRRGLWATGITINKEDYAVCKKAGYRVELMDQSFLNFIDGAFSLIWCRHCLEHSPFPLFTLSEFNRVLKADGLLYVEVPAPDTDCQHQTNVNHYSVLGLSLWIELFKKAGFTVLDSIRIDLKTLAGPDIYWAFYLKKEIMRK